MSRTRVGASVALVLYPLLLTAGPFSRKSRAPEPSPLDVYVNEATHRGTDIEAAHNSPGSLWSPTANMSDLARDLRANQIDDIVTILVAESATAVAKGATKTSRSSSAKNSITALAGPVKAGSALASPLTLSGSTQLDGQGSTTRQTTLTATLTARVTQTLSNGYMVIEGTKQIQVNSEHQVVTVRGVVRPADLTAGNVVRSDRLGQLEVTINGKGVVGDAIHRPLFLYRLILGLLPF